MPQLGGAFAEWEGQIQADPIFSRLMGLMDATSGTTDTVLAVLANEIAKHVGCSPDIVLELAKAKSEGRQASAPAQVPEAFDQSVIFDEEWATIQEALSAGELRSHQFVAKAGSLDPEAPAWVKALASGILLIHKLREVRAFQGFWRVKPGADTTMVTPDHGNPQNWIPATEVFGEGIVLSLDFALLERWSAALPEEVRKQAEELEKRRSDNDYWFLPQVSPVFLAVHTLSHLLLRRLTFECGYSSSSLRERIYFNAAKRSSGIMIYTADADSEGSLGGLVRQGSPDRLARTLVEAAESGSWCSADPVCSETAGQGLGGFNHAACHACALVSETSCTSANTLLDRRMLFAESWGLLSYLRWQE